MPVYEYRCTSCNQHFEIEHRMSEKRTECAACSGPLERLISRTSFAFKGGGWYKDLYASPKPNPADYSGKSSDAASTDASSVSSASDKPSGGSSDKPSGGSSDKPSGGSSDKPSGGGTSGGGSTGGGTAAAP